MRTSLLAVFCALVLAACGDNIHGLVDGGVGSAADAGIDAAVDAPPAPGCGDGLVGSGETCDTAIAAGSDGACPTSCDDGVACTADTLLGAGTCTAACSYTPITAAGPVDGCCPSGATLATDPDCSPSCGDGVVSDGEICDTAIGSGSGACPTTCDDGDACTTDTLVGSGTCMAQCSFTAVTAGSADGCCPAGATLATDPDCAAACGDGVVSAGETCDTAIASGPGACPTSCDDGNFCTTDTLTGSGTCTAACTNTPITTAGSADGCCPAGATLATDPDCPPGCGDGVVSAGETCDTAIASGAPGACPTSCNDGDSCTIDQLTDGGTCMAICTNTPITTAGSADGCCPSGATVATDPDCPIACGDGVVSAGETCDTAIASGSGACPTSCSGGDACTTVTLTGSACTAACTTTTITIIGAADGCCPAGGTYVTDPDCAETAFRATTLHVMDPHFYASVEILGCTDLTNFSAFGANGPNPIFDADIADYSLNVVETFQSPLDQTAGDSSATQFLLLPSGACSASGCTYASGGTPPPVATAINEGSGATCLGAIAGTTGTLNTNGTTSTYSPAIAAAVAPSGGACYAADFGSVTLNLLGLAITLADARVGGPWTTATTVSTTTARSGLIRGFLSEAEADAIIIPAGATGQSSIDGHALSSLFPGGVGNCHINGTDGVKSGDKDFGPDGTTLGWYLYLNFAATEVDFTETD